MVTTIDTRKGMVKVYWADVREQITPIETTFAKLVDELNPDKTYPLFLAYYPYGALKGDTQSTFFPDMNNGYYRFNSDNAPKDVVKHLSYSHTPLAMLLENNMELFVDLKNDKIIIPRTIYTPGAIFPFSVLSKVNDCGYTPNGILTMSSGARSVFMLPNIGCTTNHINLQRDFNVQSSPPKSLYDHWNIFKELANHAEINSDWRSCLIYFSEKWLHTLHNDRAWQSLKLYLYELGWKYYEHRRNHINYDIIFSLFQKKRNLKPNPYLADTARHLFSIAAGAAPGFIPASDDHSLPLQSIQSIYVQSYNLKKYLPTILQPHHFNFMHDEFPIYYSLQNPSTYTFSPKSRKVSSTLFEIRELEYISKIFKEELIKKNKMCENTAIQKLAKNIEFKYFHNKKDRHHIVRPSTEIIQYDSRFNLINPKYIIKEAGFASDAPFLRGCVSIQLADNQE